MLFIGLVIGTIIGISTMCMAQINKDNELKKDRDYWHLQALKWANELGEQRIGPLLWMLEERAEK